AADHAFYALSLHDALPIYVIATRDAAEDVEQDDLDVRVLRDDAERVDDLVRVRRAADVQEVRRLAAVELDQVHRGHGQAGAVDHRADVAIELDVRQPRLARVGLGGWLRGDVTQL